MVILFRFFPFLENFPDFRKTHADMSIFFSNTFKTVHNNPVNGPLLYSEDPDVSEQFLYYFQKIL